jgi:hypothetical protein
MRSFASLRMTRFGFERLPERLLREFLNKGGNCFVARGDEQNIPSLKKLSLNYSTINDAATGCNYTFRMSNYHEIPTIASLYVH